MLRKIANHYANRLVSRWVILLIDLSFVVIGFAVAYTLRFNFKLDLINSYFVGWQLLIICVFYLLGFLFFRPYSGIIRHTSVKDLENIIWANLSAFGMYLVVDVLVDTFGLVVDLRIPFSIIIIHFALVTLLMISVRFFIKSFYFNVVKISVERRSVIIYGAGKSGMIAKSALEQDDRFKYRVDAFVDDNSTKVGKKLEGVPVLNREHITRQYLEQNDIMEVIIAIQNISPRAKSELIDYFLEMDVMIKNIPATNQWMDGEFSSRQIKKIHIEDLLEREEIRLDHNNVQEQISDQVVLVTGAAGSIGSELVRQLLHYKPAKIILMDQAESALHELMLDLEQKFNGTAKKRVVGYVCDVSNKVRTRRIFEKHQPHVVYHAAAYKHVPLMESNPSEAIEVNVLGTKNIADLSVKYNADAFVLVSTDKAVNPTNIMGASKRIAEMYCQSKQLTSDIETKFITTRFGNVLGSNGSVVPLFKKQIERGGPITITHAEVTRYFMTIPEACELVLEAGTMGKGGEIFVFDMGEPVKIIDLARKMIRLSGHSEHEIQIKQIGLRPGEKLYEELLSHEENTVGTHHPKIHIATVRKLSREKVLVGCNTLLEALLEGDDNALVTQMKQMVPEYQSQNSVFELLDKPKNGGSRSAGKRELV